MMTIEQLRSKMQQQQVAQEELRLLRWAEVHNAWEKCCEAEGIDSAVQFVTFSQDNPYLAEYDETITVYVKLAA